MGERRSIGTHLLLMAGAVLVAIPFLWMLATSLKGPAESVLTDHFLPAPKTYHRYTDLLGEAATGRVEVVSESGESVTIRYLTGFRKNERREVPRGEIYRQTFLWQNYTRAWNALEPDFGVYFFNSFIVALLTTLGTLLTSALAAYAFAFFRFPGREGLFTLFLVTMMVPQQLLLIPDQLILKGLGWYDTYAALIVPFLAGAFGIFLLRQFFLNIPRELYDAAQIDGCSRLGFFFRVLLPLSVPPMVTLGIFTFLASWNALLWPLVMTDDPSLRTVQVALNFFQQAEGTSWELLMAASTLTIMPLVIAYFLAQRQFVQSIAGTGLKG